MWRYIYILYYASIFCSAVQRNCATILQFRSALRYAILFPCNLFLESYNFLANTSYIPRSRWRGLVRAYVSKPMYIITIAKQMPRRGVRLIAKIARFSWSLHPIWMIHLFDRMHKFFEWLVERDVFNRILSQPITREKEIAFANKLMIMHNYLQFGL